MSPKHATKKTREQFMKLVHSSAVEAASTPANRLFREPTVIQCTCEECQRMQKTKEKLPLEPLRMSA